MQQSILDFIKHLRIEKNLALNTQTNYQRDLMQAFDFFSDGFTAWDQLDAKHIRDFIAYSKQKGKSNTSLARSISVLRCFFTFLQREKKLKTNPVLGIKSPKKGRKLPQVPGIEQMETLLNNHEDDILLLRDKAMFELFYSSGLRLSELTSLNIHDIYWQDALVRVLGKGNKEREVPIGTQAIKALEKWLSVRDQLAKPDESGIFVSQRGTRISQRMVEYRLKKWSQEMGLPMNLHPHMLRHAFASHMLESSSDLRAVQELLGHADISTTQIYTHLDFQHLASVYDTAHPRAKKK